jgi:hypothetical protein
VSTADETEEPVHSHTRKQLSALLPAVEKGKLHAKGKLGGTVTGHLEGKKKE